MEKPQHTYNPKEYYLSERTTAQKDPSVMSSDRFLPSPYRAYRYRQTHEGINKDGFFSQEFPKESQAEFHNILLTGGSVAEQIFTYSYNKSDYGLESCLNKHYIPPNNATSFKVYNASFPSLAQPYQSIIFLLYSHLFDSVINLEGFNELFFYLSANQELSTPPPSFLVYHKDHFLNDHINIQSSLLNLLGKIGIAFEQNKISYSLYIFSKTLSKYLYQKDVATLTSTPFKDDYYVPDEKSFASSLQKHKQYIAKTHYIAKKTNTNYLVMLQPIPNLYKTLTEEEASFLLGNKVVQKSYLKLVSSLEEFAIKHKIKVVNLLKTFSDISDQVYVDKVHLNWKGRDILIGQMCAQFAKHLHLSRKVKPVISK